MKHVLLGLVFITSYSTPALAEDEAPAAETAAAETPAAETPAAETPAAETPESTSTAVVHFASTKPDVTIAHIQGHASAVAVGTGGSATVSSVYYEDLCVTPCEKSFTPGIYEFMAYGDGYTPTSGKYQVGTDGIELLVTPGSASMRLGGTLLYALGATTAITGALVLGIDSDNHLIMEKNTAIMLTGAGLVAAVTGLVVKKKGRSKMEKVR